MDSGEIQYYRQVNYTYDNEFYIMTTNSTSEGVGWECCVFCNDPDTGTRDFESLIECVQFQDQSQAKKIHADMLYKWNTIGVHE